MITIRLDPTQPDTNEKHGKFFAPDQVINRRIDESPRTCCAVNKSKKGKLVVFLFLLGIFRDS